jgi:hypothetical protein
MKADKIIDKLEEIQFDLDEGQRIRLLMVAFQMTHVTTLEFMTLEKLLKELSV